jgi:hypothetical protein
MQGLSMAFFPHGLLPPGPFFPQGSCPFAAADNSGVRPYVLSLEFGSTPSFGERIFSVTKRFIPSDRNRLKDDIIEAMSSLKHWYKADTAMEAERR